MYFYFHYRYASGTTPWGNPNAIGFEPQRHDDGHLEVIGFTYSSLVSNFNLILDENLKKKNRVPNG